MARYKQGHSLWYADFWGRRNYMLQPRGNRYVLERVVKERHAQNFFGMKYRKAPLNKLQNLCRAIYQ